MRVTPLSGKVFEVLRLKAAGVVQLHGHDNDMAGLHIFHLRICTLFKVLWKIGKNKKQQHEPMKFGSAGKFPLRREESENN